MHIETLHKDKSFLTWCISENLSSWRSTLTVQILLQKLQWWSGGPYTTSDKNWGPPMTLTLQTYNVVADGDYSCLFLTFIKVILFSYHHYAKFFILTENSTYKNLILTLHLLCPLDCKVITLRTHLFWFKPTLMLWKQWKVIWLSTS